MKYSILLFVSLFLAVCSEKVEESSFSAKTFTSSDGLELPYKVFYPEGYDSGMLFPLILFLHGSGERGTDNNSQLVHISDKLIAEDFQNEHPSIIIFPQCPKDQYWSNVEKVNGKWMVSMKEEATQPMKAVIGMLDEFRDDNPVDRTRTYVAGLSMGGFGTFDIVSRRPEWFAAAVPICGGGNRRLVPKYLDVPMWVFHGAKDSIVPVHLSQEMAEEFAGRVMDYRYTEYPDGRHNIWNKAWAEPELIPWLFSKIKVTED